MRVLVCGSRTWNDRKFLNDILNHLAKVIDIEVIIEGEAKGADTMAREWAEDKGVNVDAYPANWGEFGKAAGPIRNKQMLEEGQPKLVIAFYDGHREDSRGTANMVAQAKAASVGVLEYFGNHPYDHEITVEIDEEDDDDSGGDLR